MCWVAEPDSLYLDALRWLDGGRAEEAVAGFAQVRAARPDHAGACLNLARALLACGRPMEALATLEAQVWDCTLSEPPFLRGAALNALGRPRDAIGAFEQAIAADPTRAASFLNLGNAHADLDQLPEAERLYRLAIALDPTLPEAHASLGYVLTATGCLADAIRACDEAVRLDPGMAQAHWNRACALLLAGDYERGFAAYEWRKRHPRFRRDFPPLPGPAWEGEPLQGRTVLVRSEQGFGDTIQLARYLPKLARKGGRVVLACDAPLVALLRRMDCLAAVVAKGGALPPHDVWVDQLGLPRLFKASVDALPARSGYLTADPARVAWWARALPPGPKVGIVWAGNPAHANDRRRSMPSEKLARLLSIPDVSFVSLQTGPRSRDVQGIPDLSAGLTDYGETAAVVANLDLVLSVDTSVAHLAGALGTPVWVMLPHAPDWRWLTDRTDSPWYDSMRLFRQRRPGDWKGVVEEVEHALDVWASPAAPPEEIADWDEMPILCSTAGAFG